MKNKKIKKTIALLCILLIISTSLGLYKCVIGNDFMSSRTLLYFTVQSNILILLVSLIYLIKIIIGYKECKLFNKLHLNGTVAITITFIVFTTMLIPEVLKTGDYSFLTTISNITLHFITPILAIIIFIISPDKKFKKREPLYGLTFPIVYLIESILINIFVKEPLYTNFDGSVSRFPYFFLDYEKNGFFTLSSNFFELGVVYLEIIITIGSILLCYILVKLNKKKH